MSAITIEHRDSVAIVHAANPPVNALSHEVRTGLLDAANSLEADASVQAVILICEGRTFFAGADIREFGKPVKPPHLAEVIECIEASSKPWIAAIHGTALGGGMEVALGCHYRIGVATAKVGLPEVTLGLIPGAGGTVRLPRLIAVKDAVQLISSGRPIGAAKAQDLGILDNVIPQGTKDGDLLAGALEFANSLSTTPLPVPIASRSPVSPPVNDDWDGIIDGVTKKSRGQNSPVEAALAIRQSCELASVEAFKKERQRFIRLQDSEQSKALRYVFFAERQTTKIKRIEAVTPLAVDKCGVLGGGTMGAGIAGAMLLSGKSVVLVERDEEALEAAIARVNSILQASLKRKLIDENKYNILQSNLTASIKLDAFGDCDLIIEAVFEDMAVKCEVFTSLDAVTKPDAILATNTSYLDINEIAACVKQPGRVIGLHFFSPAHIMKLVEVIAGDSVCDQTLATGFAFAKSLRKVAVLSRVSEGFIANSIMSAYRKECDYMLEDGSTPRQIDSAMKQFGMPMGIFEMADMAGLDIGWATRKRLAAARHPDERYVRIADRLCQLGRFGQKTGAGWYVYEQGSREARCDPLVQQIIEEEAERNGITRREFTAAEIIDRILAAMTRQAKTLLKEGIAQRPSDIDMVMIHGYGFPRWRGGPMFMAGIQS